MNLDENQSKLVEITENAAGNLYQRSLKTFMKDNMLIHFAYADFEEVTFHTYLYLSFLISIANFVLFYQASKKF